MKRKNKDASINLPVRVTPVRHVPAPWAKPAALCCCYSVFRVNFHRRPILANGWMCFSPLLSLTRLARLVRFFCYWRKDDGQKTNRVTFFLDRDRIRTCEAEAIRFLGVPINHSGTLPVIVENLSANCVLEVLVRPQRGGTQRAGPALVLAGAGGFTIS